MKLSSPHRPRLGNALAFTDRFEYIPEVHITQGRATVFISVAAYTYSARTATIDNPEEFYYELENCPENAFRHYFGRRLGEDV